MPIIVSNRQADFGGYSRYTLTGAEGGVIVLVVLLSYLKSPRVRMILFSVLVSIAILTHYANSVNAVAAIGIHSRFLVAGLLACSAVQRWHDLCHRLSSRLALPKIILSGDQQVLFILLKNNQ